MTPPLAWSYSYHTLPSILFSIPSCVFVDSPSPDFISVKRAPVPLLLSVVQLLRDALAKANTRVMNLFRDWDEDGNGLIDKDEFRKAMAPLGIQVSREACNDLFDTFDPDGSGTIEFCELNKLLRQRVSPKQIIWKPLASSGLSGVNQSGLVLSSIQSRSRNLNTSSIGISSATVSEGISPVNLWKWPPQRTDISLFAKVWWQPYHGQDWRKTIHLEPLRRPLSVGLSPPLRM